MHTCFNSAHGAFAIDAGERKTRAIGIGVSLTRQFTMSDIGTYIR